MTGDKKVVIFDDETGQREHWNRDLKSRLGESRVLELSASEFEKQLDILEERRRQYRFGTASSFEEDCTFDQISILLIDYDLFELDRDSSLTGERVAYLARCYSRCDVIVGLNQFGRNTFDLTLRGHLESYADLNIGSDNFDAPGLWEEPWEGFRPWHWPLLPKLVEDFSLRLRDLREAMDQPILDFLGLNEAAVDLLPRSIVEFLEPAGTNRGGTDSNLVTFRDFVRASGHGLQGKDKTTPEMEQRIAAARIHKWLERHVLPGQNILVDKPHLVTRFTSLFSGDPERIKDWDRTTLLRGTEGINEGTIRAERFPKAHWISRPAWYWKKIQSNQQIPEISDPWGDHLESVFVFCEDISRFAVLEEASQFAADLPDSPFPSRWVSKKPPHQSVDYRPRVRFAL